MFTWECDAFSPAVADEGGLMSKHHGTETLNFEGFSGYYGSVPQGYGGFVWSDVDFLNASYWQNEKPNWCDTGYQNVVDGSGLAYSWGKPTYNSYGFFGTENTKETFSLVSMVAASAWETNQPFTFTSYVYKPHVGFVEKASVTVPLSQTAQTINFEQLVLRTAVAHPFDNISAVRITSGTGTYGNTCSYGAGHPTYGNELAFDDLKIKWNGAVPRGTGRAPGRPLVPNQHGHATPDAHLVNLHAAQAHAANGADPASHHATSAYHAELMSLSGHDTAGLTAQFHLPATEHFGS
ncbi:MAG TPA: hypothetical protein VHY79_09000 [Rhizomicrobium sp.]|jgi:hypothetical protein|nr:hypothetical protein [Rhizomicrobium sp.]